MFEPGPALDELTQMHPTLTSRYELPNELRDRGRLVALEKELEEQCSASDKKLEKRDRNYLITKLPLLKPSLSPSSNVEIREVGLIMVEGISLTSIVVYVSICILVLFGVGLAVYFTRGKDLDLLAPFLAILAVPSIYIALLGVRKAMKH